MPQAPQEQPLRPLRVPMNALSQQCIPGTPQLPKPACPACQSNPSHRSSISASLCDFHNTTPILQNRQDIVAQTELFLLSLPNEGAFARTSDDTVPSVEHIEYTFSSSRSPAASEDRVSPENVRRPRSHETSVPPIVTVGVPGHATTWQCRSSSPYSSSSFAPDFPKSEQESSLTLSNSPVEHFSSWTHRDTKTSAELCTPNPYTDITRLGVNSQGYGCLCFTHRISGSMFINLYSDSALPRFHLHWQSTERRE